MKPTDLLELNDDLQRESERLARLVTSVELLLPRLGEGWHRQLLERMATATEQRPAVFKEVTQVGLQEYLRFRHLIQEDLVEFRAWLRSTASSHNL